MRPVSERGGGPSFNLGVPKNHGTFPRLHGSRGTFPILSRDPDLSTKPPEPQGKRIRFLV